MIQRRRDDAKSRISEFGRQEATAGPDSAERILAESSPDSQTYWKLGLLTPILRQTGQLTGDKS